VRCWGRNDWGQLGDGTHGKSRARPTPGPVAALADADRIALGFGQSCARTVGGGLSCWGGSDEGQLGTGRTLNQVVPEPVIDLGDVDQVSLSGDHTCALLHDRSVKCWGSNSAAQLLRKERGPIKQPPLDPTITGVRMVAAGGESTCVLLVAGAVLCWGSDRYGQLGGHPKDEPADAGHENHLAPITVPVLAPTADTP
jgi:alpha-tubulin suppressor-like RCC1 family protein